MLHDAIELADDGPVAIRYPRGQARQVGEHEVGSGLRARLVRRAAGPADESVCVLAVGKLLAAAEKAAETLAGEGDRGHRVGRAQLRAARRRDARRRGRATAPWSPSRTASATAGSG